MTKGKIHSFLTPGGLSGCAAGSAREVSTEKRAAGQGCTGRLLLPVASAGRHCLKWQSS